jgi:hypothetical protein
VTFFPQGVNHSQEELAGHAELLNLGSDVGKLCFALVRLERATKAFDWIVNL